MMIRSRTRLRHAPRPAHSHALCFALPFFASLTLGAATLLYGTGHLIAETLRPIVALFVA